MSPIMSEMPNQAITAAYSPVTVGPSARAISIPPSPPAAMMADVEYRSSRDVTGKSAPTQFGCQRSQSA